MEISYQVLASALLNIFLFDIFDCTESAESEGDSDFYLGPCQTSMIKTLPRIDKKSPVTIFARISLVCVLPRPEYKIC